MMRIRGASGLQLQLIVTGTHLERSFGFTVKDILEDGFHIDARVKILYADNSAGIIKTAARALQKVGAKLAELCPDILVIDGDRYEYPPIAQAAVILGIPVAHIGGGDVTEGAFDDYFRHALTKLSTLHFPTNEASRKRVIQMGEDPKRVFNFGSIGIENVLTMSLFTKEELENKIHFKIDERTLLLTFHPVTRELDTQSVQLKALLDALEEKKSFRVIITGPNADTNRAEISSLLNLFIQRNQNRAVIFPSIGQKAYISAMKYCAGVVGNSSSGIIEAPSLKTGSINIGNRQKGRVMAESVIHCRPHKEAISAALDQLIDPRFQRLVEAVVNPYQGVGSSHHITKEIARFLHTGAGCKKSFYDPL